MKNIKLLDCTLRDGGYVNNWEFGREHITNIIKHLEMSDVEIVELGFLRNEVQNENRTAFEKISEINKFIKKKKKNVIYSVMIEAFNPYNLEQLAEYTDEGVDLIRICIWKRCMDKHMDYCRKVKEKGYNITIQPSRVEQYNDNEFIDMLQRANELHPYAVYIVDTWGTQSSKQIRHYVELANKYLDEDISIGYHGHNNKLQALSCTEMFLNMNLQHNMCVDASILGMGRGAGNLNVEIIMDYMNENCNKEYKREEILAAFDESLVETYKKTPWGYSEFFYLSSIYGCNPNFANYFKENNYNAVRFRQFLAQLSENEKIVFSKEFVERKLEELEI